MQAGRDYLGIVEYHEGVLGQEIGKLAEDLLFHLTVFIMQQLGRIPFRKGVFRDSGVVQAVIVIFYMNFRNHEIQKFAQS